MIRVLLADDHAVVRTGFRLLLETSADVRVVAEAGRLYDGMHGLIPRLTPLALDTLSLGETLDGFVNEWRRRHSSVTFELHHDLPADIDASVSLAIDRIVQEGVTNAVRHARPTVVCVAVRAERERVLVRVEDDGVGLPGDWTQRGRFGLRGLRERVAKLEGTFEVTNRSAGGVALLATIPIATMSMATGAIG